MYYTQRNTRFTEMLQLEIVRQIYIGMNLRTECNIMTDLRHIKKEIYIDFNGHRKIISLLKSLFSTESKSNKIIENFN